MFLRMLDGGREGSESPSFCVPQLLIWMRHVSGDSCPAHPVQP